MQIELTFPPDVRSGEREAISRAVLDRCCGDDMDLRVNEHPDSDMVPTAYIGAILLGCLPQAPAARQAIRMRVEDSTQLETAAERAFAVHEATGGRRVELVFNGIGILIGDDWRDAKPAFLEACRLDSDDAEPGALRVSLPAVLSETQVKNCLLAASSLVNSKINTDWNGARFSAQEGREQTPTAFLPAGVQAVTRYRIGELELPTLAEAIRYRAKVRASEEVDLMLPKAIDEYPEPFGPPLFLNGGGYVIHSPAAVEAFREAIHDLLIQFGYKQHAEMFEQNPRDSLLRAVVSTPFRALIERYCCIDSECREWGSEHYAQHPPKGKQPWTKVRP